MWEEVNSEYLVISYRWDAVLQKWLNDMDREWYDVVSILADNNKYVVVYRKYQIIVQDSLENTEEE
jgi:hypothetical protein